MSSIIYYQLTTVGLNHGNQPSSQTKIYLTLPTAGSIIERTVLSRMSTVTKNLEGETMHEKYVPQQIEKKWQKIWEDTKAFETHSDPSRKKYYVLEMFRTRLAISIWDMSETTPSATLSLVSRRCRDSMSFIRWALMPSVCRLKMRLSSTAFHRRNGPIPISTT